MEQNLWYTERGERAMQKDTAKIVEELGLCSDFKTFYDENKVSIGYNIYYTNAFNINGDKLNNAKYFSLRFGLGNSEASGKYETTVMINKGSEPLPWEEFTDGMASPNPQYPQPIEVSGESYNLLDCRVLTEQTINNGTFTPIYDENGNLECVNVNGTFSANATYVLQTNPKLSSGELIMSGCPSGGSENTFFLQYSNNVDFAYPDIGNGVKIEKMDSSKYPNIEVKIQIRSGYTANSLKFYPMIRKASVKNDRYMPYGVDSVEVKSVGKNLFDVNGTKTAGAVSNIVVDSDTSSVTGYCSGAMFSYVKFALDSKKFIGKQLKTTWKNGNTKQYRVRFMYKINGQNNISDTVNVTEKIEELSLHLGFNESGTAVEPFTFTFENIQIEYYGTVASVFEPYKETLSAIPTENGLASVDDIRDVIVKYADGSGDKIQRVGKEVFDGSIDENWSIRPTDKTNIYRIETTILNKKIKLPTTNAIIGKIICSHCIPVSAENTWLAKNGISVETSGNIFVYDEGYNTNDLTLWTSYLSENPMTLYYELATPIVTPLTAEEIAEIEKLHTFYPITNISNDFDCGMKITYNCDSKNYIDNKIALLTTAMINNI